MKVCYVDESGNQDTDPCLVMVGLLIDTSRLNRSKIEFGDLFDRAEALFREKLQELKASRIVFGRGGWRSIDPEERKRLAHDLCLWVMDRKHDILLTAMDRGKLRKKQHSSLPAFCTDIWLSCAVHIALQVQKANKNKPRNKGQTFLVFDENKVKADRLAEILWDPPGWTDDYYERDRRQEPLNQVIDTAFTVKSHHAGMIQVADLYAWILRRYAEIVEYGMTEEFSGEDRFINDCVKMLRKRLSGRAMRWPKRADSAAAEWFNSVAPKCLVRLG